MANPLRIKATFRVEGEAEAVLDAIKTVRQGKRAAHLVVEELRRGAYGSQYHVLPEIKDGEIENALRKLDVMAHQTVVSDDDEKRLERLIRDFGEATR